MTYQRKRRVYKPLVLLFLPLLFNYCAQSTVGSFKADAVILNSDYLMVLRLMDTEFGYHDTSVLYYYLSQTDLNRFEIVDKKCVNMDDLLALSGIQRVWPASINAEVESCCLYGNLDSVYSVLQRDSIYDYQLDWPKEIMKVINENKWHIVKNNCSTSIEFQLVPLEADYCSCYRNFTMELIGNALSNDTVNVMKQMIMLNSPANTEFVQFFKEYLRHAELNFNYLEN